MKKLNWQFKVGNLLIQKVLCLMLCFFSFYSFAKTAEYHLVLEQHLFYPAEITIPAGKKVKLVIFNKDNSPEEFDSFELNREKVLFPKRKTVIFIGPLTPGEYHFFGEFNPHLAIGKVIVKELDDAH